jgi:hypothetical protein
LNIDVFLVFAEFICPYYVWFKIWRKQSHFALRLTEVIFCFFKVKKFFENIFKFFNAYLYFGAEN